MAVDWVLHKGERGNLIGMSGTGKSTLGNVLCNRFLTEYPQGRLLILDGKPRFRATFGLNGLPNKYKGWVDGDEIKGSVGFSRPIRKLADGFKTTRCLVFQSMTPNASPVQGWESWASHYAAEFFRLTNPRRPGLLYIDEMYDLMHGTFTSSEIMQTIRAGRERALAVLIGAQRPRSIPLPVLTEATIYYTFHLEYADDIKHLQKFGPPLITIPTNHDFSVYRQQLGGHHESMLAHIKLAA